MGFLHWWEEFFCPRYRFRNFGLLESATADLGRNQKCHGGEFINIPPFTCDKLGNIPVLNVDSDGRFLLMQSTNDWYTQFVRLNIFCFALLLATGIAFLIEYSMVEPGEELLSLNFFYPFLILTPFFLFLRKIIPARSVVIFDRESGNIYFPSKLFHREIVVPYKHVVAMKFYYVYKTGMFRTYLYLCPGSRPKSEFRRFDRVYISGRDIPGHDAPLEILWCNVLRFMDKSKPLPHFESLNSHIQWYKDNNTSIPQRYANYAKLRMPHI